MDNSPVLPKVLSEDQIAQQYEHVGVTKRLIQTHRKTSKLKCITFSNRKFGYPEEAVADWLASLTDKCLVTSRTKSSNTEVGGSSEPPQALSIMEPNTISPAEESAARALAQAILNPQRKR